MVLRFIATIAILCIIGCNAGSFTSQIDLSNITAANVSKYIFGMNVYQPYGDDNPYTGNYTLGRLGGNGQSRFNFSINSKNQGSDYYFITNKDGFTWQQYYDQATKDGLSLWTQIPAMGWIASTRTKSWSFSQAKYGKQTKNECTNHPPDTTWCSEDAGNGIWLNGSDIVGNDPYDASIRTSTNDAKAFVNAVMKSYPGKAIIFSIDNEPTLWHNTHRDVHPIGSTYDEITNDTLLYAAAIKEACNDNCMVAGYSPSTWCGYFEDGFDRAAGHCASGGPDYIAHGNKPMAAFYLQQLADYEIEHNKRLLDILDIHYYPQAQGTRFNCDETNAQYISNRLQAPRSLYDWSYVDGSWITDPIAAIPRFKQWIQDYYPGTKLSISEYNFGGDDCITSTIAHSEALAIFATFGVEAATRWSKPLPGAPVTNAWNIFTNYDGAGSNIYSCSPYAVNVLDSNLEIVTSYSLIAKDESKMFVIFYNKDENNKNTVSVSLINNKQNLSISSNIDVYGVDKSGLSHIGNITPTNAQTFTIDLPPWSIRLAILNL